MKLEIYIKFRDKANLKDYDVSKLTGISPQSICQWKLGQTRLKLQSQIQIAKALNIPQKLWLEEEEEKKR